MISHAPLAHISELPSFSREATAINSGREGLIPPAASILSQESSLLMEQQLAKVLRAGEWGAYHT